MSDHFLLRLLPLGEVLFAGGLLLHGCGGGGGGAADAPAKPNVEDLKLACASLNGQVVEGVAVSQTTRFEAGAAGGTAGFCQVQGTRTPYLDIEVVVPDNWTGRYWQQGGGGFDGRIPSALTSDGNGKLVELNPVVALKGAVYAASNGGNRADIAAQAAPQVWWNGTDAGRQSAIDYAYAATGTTLQFGKAVAKAFHGKAPSYSYFNGCSNGGRNAYIVAQRWPQEFDGIVAGCETMDMSGQTSAWLQSASFNGSPAALSAAQSSAAYAAAVSACDALDGVNDQVLANPMACKLDPAALQCGAAGASSDPAICLNAEQVRLARSYLQDLQLPDGRTVLSAYWWGPRLGQYWGQIGGGFAFLATGNAAWLTPARQAAFLLESDYPLLTEGFARMGADHDKAAIARFVASGRKLISWHAGNDDVLSPNDHYRNWYTMTGLARSEGLANPETATRFFVVPGTSHGQGQLLQEVDWATAIMAWVENGVAPTQLTYSFQSGAGSRSIPVCQHPLYPRYQGAGDVNLASSFSCVP